MEIKNSQFVPQTPDQTWKALNDPEILRACIPGCESVTKISDTEMQIVMQAKVGPVSAKFRGKMQLSDLNPPTSYTVGFEGQGGAMGFGKGQAKVSLAPTSGGTTLSYAVVAQVGGKLAQIGSRLIDSAALKLADDFFTRFIDIVASPEAAAAPATAVVPDTKTAKSARWWLLAIVVLAVVAYFALKS